MFVSAQAFDELLIGAADMLSRARVLIFSNHTTPSPEAWKAARFLAAPLRESSVQIGRECRRSASFWTVPATFRRSGRSR